MPSDRPRTRIKFCGMTTVGDVEAAAGAGADAVGVIFAESPRRVSLEQARAIRRATPAFVTLIAVVADPPDELLRDVRALGAVPQLHGDEPPDEAPYIKAFHVDAGETPDLAALERYAALHPNATLLLDSRSGSTIGGTGLSFAWPALREFARRRRIIMSGGLTPENVGACIRAVRPYAVDVRSGIETGGLKDRVKMAAFVEAVREADASA